LTPFTGGFDTRDLKEAKELLEELAQACLTHVPRLPLTTRVRRTVIAWSPFDPQKGALFVAVEGIHRVSPCESRSPMSRRAGHGGVTVRSLRSKSDSSSAPPTLPKRWSKQTATSDVLEVISRSAFDFQAVFETVAESSVRLCGADRAFIFRFDGELLRMVVGYNSTPAFVEWVEPISKLRVGVDPL
jgi:hypothetical protein